MVAHARRSDGEMLNVQDHRHVVTMPLRACRNASTLGTQGVESFGVSLPSSPFRGGARLGGTRKPRAAIGAARLRASGHRVLQCPRMLVLACVPRLPTM
jgi:hypothetical protein